jgi:hypothetical protein
MDSPPSIWDIERALDERDFDYLSRLIIRQDLTEDVRAHLAGVVRALLTGEIKFPSHRPKSIRTFAEAVKIGNRVHQLKWQGVKKAIAVAATEFKCSISKVEKVYANHKKALANYQREKAQNDYMMDMAYDAARDAAVTHLKEEHGDREFTDEEVSDEIEAQQQAWADFDDR